MQNSCKNIFIGGYSKSGTTFVGRAFDILTGVYARGEQDYFRQFFNDTNKMVRDYNTNLAFVNKEVYDGNGSLNRLNNDTVRGLHQKIFYHLFFNGEPIPDDCRVVVEKSPHNIFWIDAINFTFPDSVFVCVYRDPQPVFRSMMRHLRDHRSRHFADPESGRRQKMFRAFLKQWELYISVIETKRERISVVRYDRIAADTAGFLDYAQRDLIGEHLGLSAPLETLSKDYYLSQLSPEARAKSLVQTSAEKITLSDEEMTAIENQCRTPSIDYDF